MQDLIDKTHAVHYELYRRTKLEDMGFSDGGGDKQPHRLQETYELRRQEYMKNIQGREEQMRQSFVNKVKEKEAELKQAEQEVTDVDFPPRPHVCLQLFLSGYGLRPHASGEFGRESGYFFNPLSRSATNLITCGT